METQQHVNTSRQRQRGIFWTHKTARGCLDERDPRHRLLVGSGEVGVDLLGGRRPLRKVALEAPVIPN